MEKEDGICVNTSSCSIKRTSFKTYIEGPYPQVLMFNINWFDNQVPYLDTLKFAVSIPQRFKMKDLFCEKNEGATPTPGQQHNDDCYILKAIVCFLGAHYMTFVKMIVDEHPVWRLYDDTEISIYQDWTQILYKILEFGTLPTVLVYEKVTKSNNDFDAYDKINSTQLEELFSKAQELQDFIDQFEQESLQNQRVSSPKEE